MVSIPAIMIRAFHNDLSQSVAGHGIWRIGCILVDEVLFSNRHGRENILPNESRDARDVMRRSW